MKRFSQSTESADREMVGDAFLCLDQATTTTCGPEAAKANRFQPLEMNAL